MVGTLSMKDKSCYIVLQYLLQCTSHSVWSMHLMTSSVFLQHLCMCVCVPLTDVLYKLL